MRKIFIFCGIQMICNNLIEVTLYCNTLQEEDWRWSVSVSISTSTEVDDCDYFWYIRSFSYSCTFTFLWMTWVLTHQCLENMAWNKKPFLLRWTKTCWTGNTLWRMGKYVSIQYSFTYGDLLFFIAVHLFSYLCEDAIKVSNSLLHWSFQGRPS